MTQDNKPTTSLSQIQTNNTTIANTNTLRIKRSLRDRIANPTVDTTVINIDAMPNRIALLLDCSGSMTGGKIQALRDACVSFVQGCNLGDTALALETFGDDANGRLALTCFEPLLTTTIATLRATGGTPMADAMNYALRSYSLTRTVLVSDGEPDNETAAYAQASCYREAGLICDCVHIGNSTSGEEVLRRIAEMTGGQYIKFTDIAAFSRSFKYLTPAMYGMLSSGNVSAAELGAKELK